MRTFGLVTLTYLALAFASPPAQAIFGSHNRARPSKSKLHVKEALGITRALHGSDADGRLTKYNAVVSGSKLIVVKRSKDLHKAAAKTGDWLKDKNHAQIDRDEAAPYLYAAEQLAPSGSKKDKGAVLFELLRLRKRDQNAQGGKELRKLRKRGAKLGLDDHSIDNAVTQATSLKPEWMRAAAELLDRSGQNQDLRQDTIRVLEDLGFVVTNAQQVLRQKADVDGSSLAVRPNVGRLERIPDHVVARYVLATQILLRGKGAVTELIDQHQWARLYSNKRKLGALALDMLWGLRGFDPAIYDNARLKEDHASYLEHQKSFTAELASSLGMGETPVTGETVDIWVQGLVEGEGLTDRDE